MVTQASSRGWTEPRLQADSPSLSRQPHRAEVPAPGFRYTARFGDVFSYFDDSFDVDVTGTKRVDCSVFRVITAGSGTEATANNVNEKSRRPWRRLQGGCPLTRQRRTRRP
jgi:hypothetical protein